MNWQRCLTQGLLSFFDNSWISDRFVARVSNKEIAAQLVISLGTVKGHTIHIYQKMDVKNRREAVEKAVAFGMLNPNKLAPK
jgi:LuxR family maltose regulon positive regulatory protein